MTHPLSAPFLRRGPYSFFILAALCVAVLAALGAWQVTRLAQKEAVIAEDAGAVNPYRRVMITGRFLHEQEIAVGPKPRLGRAGWQVITPLKRTDGRIVFVDRGWVPENRKDPRSRPEGQVTGTITVTGILKRVAPRGRFVPDNDAAKGNWYWFPMSRPTGLSPAVIVTDRSDRSVLTG
jgi:surfeit locus 1 family protein